MEKNMESLNKTASTNGLIIGIITSAVGIVVYYVMPSMMGSISFGVGVGLLSLLLYIVFTLDLRKKVGNYWSFREALKGIFLMAFVAGVVNMLINLIFYKFIEPGAYEKIAGYVGDSMTQNFERFGMDQEKIDQAVAQGLQRLKSQFNPGVMDIFKNLTMQILVQFVMSLIFAAIFKKEHPIFIQKAEE
jgi:hypothetical protein